MWSSEPAASAATGSGRSAEVDAADDVGPPARRSRPSSSGLWRHRPPVAASVRSSISQRRRELGAVGPVGRPGCGRPGSRPGQQRRPRRPRGHRPGAVPRPAGHRSRSASAQSRGREHRGPRPAARRRAVTEPGWASRSAAADECRRRPRCPAASAVGVPGSCPEHASPAACRTPSRGPARSPPRLTKPGRATLARRTCAAAGTGSATRPRAPGPARTTRPPAGPTASRSV